MNIRTATYADLQSIKDLYRILDADAVRYQPRSFALAERPDEFLIGIMDGEKSDFLVAELNGRAIVFALLQEKETPNLSCLRKLKYAYVLDLVIKEGLRDRGYGAALMEAAKDWGRHRGLDLLRLSVFEGNDRGIRFYERLGLEATMRTMECEL